MDNAALFQAFDSAQSSAFSPVSLLADVAALQARVPTTRQASNVQRNVSTLIDQHGPPHYHTNCHANSLSTSSPALAHACPANSARHFSKARQAGEQRDSGFICRERFNWIAWAGQMLQRQTQLRVQVRDNSQKNLDLYKTKIELARKNIDLYKTNRQLVKALQNERKAHKGTLSRLNLQLASTNARKRKRSCVDSSGQVKKKALVKKKASAGTPSLVKKTNRHMKKKAAPNKKNGPRKKKAAPSKRKVMHKKAAPKKPTTSTTNEQRKQQLKDGTKSLKLWLKEMCIIVKWHKFDKAKQSTFPDINDRLRRQDAWDAYAGFCDAKGFTKLMERGQDAFKWQLIEQKGISPGKDQFGHWYNIRFKS
jgi:hypothetical protein